MKFIIDTHIFLWALSEPDKLSPSQTQALKGLYNQVYVSAISIAELAIKASIGKLDLSFDPVEMVNAMGFEALPYAAKDALMLKALPFHHKDPFDRMLIGQSLASDIPIMTNDAKFQLYGCKLI
ncbi:MAG: type II toxin-antitoxin system VapC family toxin [Hahellaceae bacterium]|nr:type II toxin-antitoxin system VapC family toxin [Hahellaceae bacterium]MCP5169357.1 type II toxin-antitoxin system VapC family toxin [Hahellaceae bacterium]